MRFSARASLLTLFCFILFACSQNPLLLVPGADGGNSGGTDGGRSDFALPDFTFGDRSVAFPDASRDGANGNPDGCTVRPEVCNNQDDNCDGKVDEGFDKLSSSLYCDGCRGCQWLVAKNAIPGCKDGTCIVAGCVGGFVDRNKEIDDGCEVACVFTGDEVCDGVDNNCDGKVDEDVAFPGSNPCRQQGACSGSAPVCRGEEGWVCNYGGDVELLPCSDTSPCGTSVKCANGRCPGTVIAEEQQCDAVDGDCDGSTDDPWIDPTQPGRLGTACNPNPAAQGICIPEGRYECAADGDGVQCKQTKAGLPPRDERCNALDDDCDGKIDENDDDAAGKGIVDDMVRVNWSVGGKAYDFYIYRHEASRADATSASAGQGERRPCANPYVLPWASLTQAEAAAACVAAGKRLCTNEEWVVACRGPASAGAPTGTAYPYGNTYEPNTCNGADRPNGAPALTGALGECKNDTLGAFDLSGNLREWTADPIVLNPAPPKPIFVVRGGAYSMPAPGLACSFDSSQAVSDAVLPSVGFRCCSNEAP